MWTDLGLSRGKKCGRCSTRYCGPACQKKHWEEGHDQLCRRIKKGGGAEQFHADKKCTAAVTEAVEACAEDTKGQTCYICTQALHWKTKEGLVRMCACRGTAGFVHVSCLAEQAKILVAESEENHLDDTRWRRWYKCSLCEQHYHGLVSCALGWACWKTYLGRPEDDWARRNAMTELGTGLSLAGRHAETLTVREANFAILRRVGASESDILAVQSSLANTYQDLGRSEEALPLRRDVYFGFLNLGSEETKDALIAGTNYATHLNRLERYAEAKPLLRKLMPVARRVLGNNDDTTLKMRGNYAEALYEDVGATLDDLRESVTTLEDVERTARRVFGGAHPTTVGLENELQEAREVLRASETPLRFKVGSRVKCCVDEGRWASGTVIRLWYTEDGFAEGYYAPYQVELDEGNLIFAPEDSDRCVRRAPSESA